MTTVQRVQPPPTAGIRPKVVARTGLYALIAVNVAVVAYFFAQSPTDGYSTMLLIGRLCGLYGALTMAFQLLLIARLPWLDRRIGMDKLTSWHRWVGFTLLWTLVAHVVLVTLAYADLSDVGFFSEIIDLAQTSEGVLRAIVAFCLILLIGAASARYARRRLAYETWHFIHLYAYVAVVLAFTHQVAIGTTFTSTPAAKTYWYVVWGAALGAVALGRLVLPLWRNWRHQLRVTAVVPESDNVVSVYMTGRDLDRMPAAAGQFFLWRFLTKDRWWQANPFSLSAAPDGQSLRLTAKAAGDGSASLRHIKVGTRVFAEGPYGAFTAMHRTRPETLLIAGGVGITPMRALLEELENHVVLIYRVGTHQDAVLLEELRELAAQKGAELHLVTGPVTPDLLDANGLTRLVPDILDRDVFVCGPPGMTTALLRTLRHMGVPKQQIHAERFSLAG
ncbi:Ferric reductase domain protein transmembrane component domain-containing protein [Actinobacteria bacterium OK074]|nr:Ferric reductase domain protein transmembrane component domain-containing protein [Actinobacteria bacterium OK074]